MYIYHTGVITEAIHRKIENARDSVMNGAEKTESFRDILYSLMEKTDIETKVVGTASARGETAVSGVKRSDGSALMYAINNADSDSTASAVAGRFGVSTAAGNEIKTTADGLSSALTLLKNLNGMSDKAVIPQLSEFTEKFNSLLSALRTNTTSTGFMYANLLKTAASTASDALAKAGVTVSEDGKLTLDTEKFSELGLEGFLATVSAAADSISTYSASAKSKGTGVLDFLTENEYTDGGSVTTGNYYDKLLDYYI